jgi:transposase
MSLERSDSVINRCPWDRRHPPKRSDNFDASAKSYVGWLMAKSGLSVQIANSRYGVPISTLYEWKKAANKGLQHNGKGRRPLLEQCDIERLRAECEDDSRKGIKGFLG